MQIDLGGVSVFHLTVKDKRKKEIWPFTKKTLKDTKVRDVFTTKLNPPHMTVS